jgi:hypothetical protein
MEGHQVNDENLWITEKLVVNENVEAQRNNNINQFFGTQGDRIPFGDIQNFRVREKKSDIEVKERLYLRGNFLGSGGYAECYEVETTEELAAAGRREGRNSDTGYSVVSQGKPG